MARCATMDRIMHDIAWVEMGELNMRQKLGLEPIKQDGGCGLASYPPQRTRCRIVARTVLNRNIERCSKRQILQLFQILDNDSLPI